MKYVVCLTLGLGLVGSACSPSANQSTEQAAVRADSAAAVPTIQASREPSVLYPELQRYAEARQADMADIPENRKQQLRKVALFVRTKKASGEAAHLTFICTHNSRRSHVSQLWAEAAAHHYGVADDLHTYSGGTEVTAFNPRAVAAMERAGFRIRQEGQENPHYLVTFAPGGPTIDCFSKKYDDPVNVSENFVAVMTCSEADRNCPYIPGATLRVPLPYEDPKAADETPAETAQYDARCQQIAAEMFYLMSQVKASQS